MELATQELEVLLLLSRGLSNKELARCQRVSGETINERIESIKHKLAAKTRPHAVAIGIRQGLIQ